MHQIAPLFSPCCFAASDWASPALADRVVWANRSSDELHCEWRARARCSHGERHQPDFERKRMGMESGGNCLDGTYKKCLLLFCCLASQPRNHLKADVSPKWSSRQQCAGEAGTAPKPDTKQSRQNQHSSLTSFKCWVCIRAILRTRLAGHDTQSSKLSVVYRSWSGQGGQWRTVKGCWHNLCRTSSSDVERWLWKS